MLQNMKLKHLSVLLAALTLLLAFQNVGGQSTLPAPGSKVDVSDDISLLYQFPLTRRSETASVALHLLEHRTNFTQILLRQVGTSNINPDVIVVLGEYRITESAAFLVLHLDLDFEGRSWNIDRLPDPNQPIYVNTVSTALEKIGMPAISALMDRIAKEDDAKLLERCLAICNAIEGAEVTQFRLQRLAERETDPKRKKHLQSALKVHAALKPVKWSSVSSWERHRLKTDK